jgi:hypothetical protein
VEPTNHGIEIRSDHEELAWVTRSKSFSLVQEVVCLSTARALLKCHGPAKPGTMAILGLRFRRVISLPERDQDGLETQNMSGMIA